MGPWISVKKMITTFHDNGMIKQCFVLQFYMNGKDNYTVVLSRALFRRYFRLVAILVGNERQSSRFSI